jgi:hypothetical protein
MRHRLGRIAVAWLLALATIIAAMTPAGAIDRVSVTIGKGGGVGASLTSAAFSRSPSAGSGSISPGILELVVDDRRGSAAGWQISLESVGLLDPAGAAFATLALTRTAAPFVIAGQPVLPDGPLARGGAGLPLAGAQCVIFTAAGTGSGVYGQRIGVLAATADDTTIETMTGEIIVTIGSAP